MIRRMRTMNEVVKFIKKEDSGTSINRHIIESLVLSRKVFYVRLGNVIHVDLDDCLEKLMIIRRG
ncbi:MAG: hypothetical protein J6Y28_09350 [Acholeplasmatales bacterium]|nr:hypothetical protein [Acholeplasmatales bacterium]